jgi:hypothetical protein|nr:MAG TPA: hypothetical protein [Caudoviricetes sp.]
MHQEFFDQRLKECEEKRYNASLVADFKGFQYWDAEYENYKRMQIQWENMVKNEKGEQ